MGINTDEEAHTPNIGYTKSGHCFADSFVLNFKVQCFAESSVEARLRVAVKRQVVKIPPTSIFYS